MTRHRAYRAAHNQEETVPDAYQQSRRSREVWLTRRDDGTVTVDHAGDRILVADAVAAYARREDGTLVLDTAGQYRYQLADDQADRLPGTHFYERISPADQPTTLLADQPTTFGGQR